MKHLRKYINIFYLSKYLVALCRKVYSYSKFEFYYCLCLFLSWKIFNFSLAGTEFDPGSHGRYRTTHLRPFHWTAWWRRLCWPSGLHRAGKSDGSCSSYIGRMAIGEQDVQLATGCLKLIGEVQHELLHVLGLYHEQSRMDRDQYVYIVSENIFSAPGMINVSLSTE